MDIDDGNLIELVRQFSVLYNPKHIEYKNQRVKQNAWESIASILNVPGKKHNKNCYNEISLNFFTSSKRMRIPMADVKSHIYPTVKENQRYAIRFRFTGSNALEMVRRHEVLRATC